MYPSDWYFRYIFLLVLSLLGSGTGLSVTLTTGDNRVSTLASVFAYQAPQINQISPTSGVSSGGFVMTVTGTSFGSSGDVFFVSGSKSLPCTTPVRNLQQTQITCTAPAGVGSGYQISISTSGLQSQYVAPTTFAYNSPTISSFSPNVAGTAGGTRISLSGSNFGVLADGAQFRFGSFSCTLVAANHVSASCDIASGQGNSLVFLIVSSFFIFSKFRLW